MIALDRAFPFWLTVLPVLRILGQAALQRSSCGFTRCHGFPTAQFTPRSSSHSLFRWTKAAITHCEAVLLPTTSHYPALRCILALLLPL